MSELGPGTLTIGTTPEIVASCLMNSARVTSSKDQGSSTTKLCGTVKAGAVTYTAQLTGNLDIDSAVDDGLFALSWAHAGEEYAFEFTPNTVDGTMASGTLVIDPLDFGGDTYGEDMTSDFTWEITGEVTWTFPDPGGRSAEPREPVTFQIGKRPRRIVRGPQYDAAAAAASRSSESAAPAGVDLSTPNLPADAQGDPVAVSV